MSIADGPIPLCPAVPTIMSTRPPCLRDKHRNPTIVGDVRLLARRCGTTTPATSQCHFNRNSNSNYNLRRVHSRSRSPSYRNRNHYMSSDRNSNSYYNQRVHSRSRSPHHTTNHYMSSDRNFDSSYNQRRLHSRSPPPKYCTSHDMPFDMNPDPNYNCQRRSHSRPPVHTNYSMSPDHHQPLEGGAVGRLTFALALPRSSYFRFCEPLEIQPL